MPESRQTNGMETNHAEQPATPIWAPTPGVPIVARLLAYSFGAMMLLTILATLSSKQAPDIPPIPQQWSVYQMDPKTAISYPNGWHIVESDEDDPFDIHFVLMPNSPVEVAVMQEERPANADYLFIDGVNREWESRLSATLTNFAVNNESLTVISDHGRGFTFTDKSGRLQMSGAWVIVPKGRYIFCLFAFAPREAWTRMQVILSEMASRVSSS